MNWFSILKKAQEWTGELPDRKKKRLKRKPTIIVDLPQLSPPDGKEELCLLYTSPSPRDLSTSRMPSSA